MDDPRSPGPRPATSPPERPPALTLRSAQTGKSHARAPPSLFTSTALSRGTVAPGKSPMFRAHGNRKRAAAADASSATKAQFEAALAERDAEIAELHEQVAFEKRRTAMVESELKLTAAAAQQAEAAHGEEMSKVEGDLKRVLAERRSLMHQMQTTNLVDDAVRELYLQMKERFADAGPPTPEQLQAEKEAIKGENILVVLGNLHALLKGLWVFKVEADADMRGTRDYHQHVANESSEAMRARIRGLDAELRTARQQEAAAKLQLKLESESKAKVLDASHMAVREMEAQHAELVAQLQQAAEEALSLRSALEEAQEEGRKRDGLVMANRQLESSRHFDRAAQDKQLRLMQQEHARQLASMEREMHRMSDLMAGNAHLRQQLDSANDQLAAYKRAERQNTRHELHSQIRALEERAASQSQVLTRLVGWALEVVEAGVLGAAGLPPPPLPAPPPSARDSVGGATGTSGSGIPPAVLVSSDGSMAGAAAAAGEGPSGQSMIRQAQSIMESLRDQARKAQREKEAERDTDPIYKVIANVGSAHKQAVRAIKDARRELGDGPTALREAHDAGAPPVSESVLVGLGGMASRQQRGFSGLAGEGPAGGVGPGGLYGGSANGMAMRRASIPSSVTGLPDWRGTGASTEALQMIKATMDAGLAPASPGGRRAEGQEGEGQGRRMDRGGESFARRVKNVGRVQSARP